MAHADVSIIHDAKNNALKKSNIPQVPQQQGTNPGAATHACAVQQSCAVATPQETSDTHNTTASQDAVT